MLNEKSKRVPKMLEHLFSLVMAGHGEKILAALHEVGLASNDTITPPLTEEGFEKIVTSVHNGLVTVFASADIIIPPNTLFDEKEPLQDILDAAGEARVQTRSDGSGLFDLEFTGRNPIVSRVKNLPFDPNSLKGHHVIDIEAIGKLRIVGNGVINEDPQFPGAKKPGKLFH